MNLHVVLLYSQYETLFRMCIVDFSEVIALEATYNANDVLVVLDSSFVRRSECTVTLTGFCIQSVLST